MSAPRVDLNHSSLPDLDPSAPSNQINTPQTNGSANGNGNLAQSAQKAGNSILESKVRKTASGAYRTPANTVAVLSKPRTRHF